MKNKLVPAIILIVILGLAGYYFVSKKGPTKNTESQSANQIVSEASEFAKAIESGKPTTCTMSKSGDTMEYQIKNKKMRMKTTSTTTTEDGKTTTTVGHMINDTAYLYIWDDNSKQGSKMAIPTEEQTKEMAEKAKQYQADAPVPQFETESDYKSLKEEGYAINCKASNIDDSVFTPPSDVKFIDPTSMMQTIPAQGEGGKVDMSQIQELKKQFGGEIPANY